MTKRRPIICKYEFHFLTMNGEFPFEKSSYDDFVMIIINKNSSNIAHFDDLFSHLSDAVSNLATETVKKYKKICFKRIIILKILKF